MFIFQPCLVLLFLYFSFNRKRSGTNVKKPVTKDDIRENIINYCDEGGGENDMTAFDMKTLKIPISSQLPELVQHKGTSSRKFEPLTIILFYNLTIYICECEQIGPDIAVVSNEIIKVETVMEDRKRRADGDSSTSQFDDLRNYAYEGRGSTSGSLSSLQSGTKLK